jgi:hypothetical protein
MRAVAVVPMVVQHASTPQVARGVVRVTWRIMARVMEDMVVMVEEVMVEEVTVDIKK